MADFAFTDVEVSGHNIKDLWSILDLLSFNYKTPRLVCFQL